MISDRANTLTGACPERTRRNAENRVVSATNGGSSGTYSYDGNNLRVEKVSGSTTTVTIFSGGQDIAEYVNGAVPSSPNVEFIYAGSQLTADISGSTTYYFHQDQLSNRLLTDSSGNVATQRGNFPFGEEWYQTGVSTKWKFTTYARDTESGNDYALARSYVNRLARFSSPDLLAGDPTNPQSLDRYAYVRNDPENILDPTGRCIGLLNDNGDTLNCVDSFDCSIDGFQSSCSMANGLVQSGAGVACPENDCGRIYSASAHGYLEKVGLPPGALVLNCVGQSLSEHACFWASWSLQFVEDGTDPYLVGDDTRLKYFAGQLTQRAGAITDWRTIALWYGASLFGAGGQVIQSVASLDAVTVAVGEGSPFHVAVGASGTWIHATGDFFGMTVTSDGAAAWVRGFAWFEFNIPVLSPEAVLATAGAAASTCVTGACSAILNGWLP